MTRECSCGDLARCGRARTLADAQPTVGTVGTRAVEVGSLCSPVAEDSIGTGIALLLLGVPLGVPLTLLVFFAAFLQMSCR